MPHVGVQPVPKATWKMVSGQLSSETDTIHVQGGYTVGYINLYIEGRLIPYEEYEASDGVSIVFEYPLEAGTNYTVEKVTPFTAPDHYTKSESDERYFDSHENMILNPTFTVNQRDSNVEISSPVQSDSRTFISDRWFMPSTGETGGNINFTKTRNDPNLWIGGRHLVLEMEGLSDPTFIAQRVDKILHLSEKTVTVSFQCNSDNGMGIEVVPTIRWDISGNSITELESKQVQMEADEFQHITHTFDIPNLGPDSDWNNNTCLELKFRISSPNGFESAPFDGYYRFSGFKLQEGQIATPLKTRLWQRELELCQRYYESHEIKSMYAIGNGKDNPIFRGSPYIFFQTRKRAEPSVDYTIGEVKFGNGNESQFQFQEARMYYGSDEIGFNLTPMLSLDRSSDYTTDTDPAYIIDGGLVHYETIEYTADAEL